VSSRDRDFRPTRRRGFDDDNFGSPRRSFGSTPGSSVQRFEVPSGHPVQAVVKWYNADKGFGFVQLADGSGDAFLHVSIVERGGHSSVPPGATLEVRAGPGPKGPQVTEILSVDSRTSLASIAAPLIRRSGYLWRSPRRTLLQQRAQRADNRAGGLTKPWAGPISTSRMT
jgi:cold shock protein